MRVPYASASFTWKVPCGYAWSRQGKCKDEGGTHSLSGETLAQNFGVLVDEEVPDSVIIGATRCRLGERPAPSCFQSGKIRTAG